MKKMAITKITTPEVPAVPTAFPIIRKLKDMETYVLFVSEQAGMQLETQEIIGNKCFRCDWISCFNLETWEPVPEGTEITVTFTA